LLVVDRVDRLDSDPFVNVATHPTRTSSSTSFLDKLRDQRVPDQKDNQPGETVNEGDTTLIDPQIQSVNQAPSEDSSSDDSSRDSDSQMVNNDLLVWRNGLLPHQASLFDELVNVAHRLVAHLADKETAAYNIVEDYRRRGSRLIEQMELSHAASLQKHTATLKERKKLLRKELADCGRELKECSDTLAAVQRQRSKRDSLSSKTVAEMQDLIAQYC
jgi:hypothetical protein